jgi:crotonobetainyl-CoA:carnitine CoA-transferase CaiB-like acyl-CoA transferase
MNATGQTSRNQPFHKIRVLDLTRVLASPYASYLLALLGADVIKIEDPRGGDAMRTRNPGDPDLGALGMGTGFLSQNGNKRSVSLDLRTDGGQEVFRTMAAKSDVIIENLRHGTMDRYGLGYEAIRALNPGIVYCSLTGYGHTGEKHRHPAYDPVLQASSGIMRLTGDGRHGPIKAGIPAIDYGSGMIAAFGVVSALYERTQSGMGQHVDLSMLDTALAMMGSVVTDVMTRGSQPKPNGNSLGPTYGTNRLYSAGEGFIWISAPEEHQQRALWQVIGREDIPADPEFATEALRARNVDRLTVELEKALAERTALEWESELNEAGVPAMAVRTLPETLQMPQLASRDRFHTFPGLPGWEHAFTVLKLPFILSSTPASLSRRPPLLGEHTEEVLREIGFDDRRINALREAGAI